MLRIDGCFEGSRRLLATCEGGVSIQSETPPFLSEPAFELSGQAGRFPFTHPNDDFVQAGNLYRKVMTDKDRTHLIGNIVDHLGGAQKRIQLRQTAVFYKADPYYGRRVADGLGLDIKEVERLAAMSQEERAKATA